MDMRMLQAVSLLLCAAMALTAPEGLKSVPSTENFNPCLLSEEHKIAERCPNGWNDFFGNCYKYEIQPARDWADAEKNCLSQGGNLASVHSTAEDAFIRDLIRSITNNGNSAAWIGGYDATKEGVWLWSDGRPMTFTSWNTGRGEPNNSGGREHCIMMYTGDKWNDGRCEWRIPSVCKINNMDPAK